MTKLLSKTAVLLLLTALIAAAVIRTGWLDPKPVGSLQAAVQPGVVTIPAGETLVQWLDVQLPDTGFSVRETAVFQSGNPDILTGLALETTTQTIHVTFSPLGYISINTRAPDASLFTPHLPLATRHAPRPLQPWPHVRTGTTPNEIWIDVEDGQLTVRINRELLWVGEVDGVPQRLGVAGQSFGETAVMHFQSVEIFFAP